MHTPPLLFGPRNTGLQQAGDSDLQQVLGKFLEILRRRKWLFILPILTGALLVLVVSLFVPRVYVATASFERADDVVLSSLIQTNTPYSFTTLREAAPVDLLGYDAVARAVDQLGLLDHLPVGPEGRLTDEAKFERRQFISGLAGDLSHRLVQNGNRQDVIYLRYEGKNPQLGEKMISRIMDNYVTLMQTKISDILHQSHEFFRKEAAGRKKRVARLMWEQIQFGLDHPGVMPDDPDVLDRRLEAETRALDEIRELLKAARAKLEAQEEYLGEIEEQAEEGFTALPTRPQVEARVVNPTWKELDKEIQHLEEQVADLRTTLTDEHPKIVGLLNKIDIRRRKMESTPQWLTPTERPETVQQDPREAWEAEKRRIEMERDLNLTTIAELEAGELEHRQAIKEIGESKRRLFERREEFMAMQQELDDARADLRVWNKHAETLEQVLVATTQDRGIQFAIIDEARSKLIPEYPTLLGVFTMASGVGLGLGAALVFLRELLDRSLRHPSRVRQTLGIPVLETIGEIRTGRMRTWILRQQLLPAVAMVETVGIMAVSLLIYISLTQPMMYENIIDQVKRLWAT